MDSEFIYFADKLLEKDIGIIKQDQIKPYWSDGRWSMHDLLMFLLKLTGGAKVYLSTFSISEAAIRSFNHAIKTGLITELNCLFDYTVKRHKLQLLYFASNVANDIRLAPNHSKLILIENKDWTISVVGSANMTPNPRKEAGVILTDRNTFLHYKKHLIKTMLNGTDIGLSVNAS